MAKRALHQLKMRELAGVTKPAQEPALALLMKLDRTDPAYGKAAFDVALTELQLGQAVSTAMNEMWTLHDALRNSVQEISQNPDRYPDARKAIKESVQQYAMAVATMVQGVVDDLDGKRLMEKANKTEDGEEFPAGDYAYVPDPEKSSTWKLRLTATPGGGPDARIVGAAVAALGPGFRGKKVQIPEEDLPKVKARVRQAWHKANPDSEELPAVLKSEEDEMTKTAEQLQVELDAARAYGALNDAEKAHYAKLDARGQEAFMKMGASDRATTLQKAQDADPVVYTATSGAVFRKSDDPRLVEQVKRGDELEKRTSEQADALETERLTKRADGELANLPGDAKVKVALLKAVDGIKDEETRKGVTELLKAGNEAQATAFTKIGSKGPSVGNDLDALTKAYQAKNPNVSYSLAQAAVLDTPEGKAAYAATQK